MDVPVEGSWSTEYSRVAQELLSRLACEVLLSDSEQGVVRAARRLGVSGGVKLAEIGRDEYWSYAGRAQLSPLLESGWHGALETFLVFSGIADGGGMAARPVPSRWERIRGAHSRIVEGLFESATMAVSCGHDGETLHVIVCSSEREDVWNRLLSGADALGVELIEDPTKTSDV